MTSTPVFHQRASKEPDAGASSRRGISLILGVLWMVGAAALWILGLVLFHVITARLLS